MFIQGDQVEIAQFIRETVKNELHKCHEEAQRIIHGSTGQKLSLLIDGKCLMYALDPSFRSTLLSLSLSCTSVVCCRVSPLQKAQVRASFFTMNLSYFILRFIFSLPK